MRPVIAGASLAAGGRQSLTWIILVALVGALIGDHVSYGIGRLAGTRAVGRVLRGDKGRAARAWAEDMLRIRGGLVIVALRFVPGGRTATTLTAGTLSYPLPRFTAFASVAALLWATYGGLVGYLAGGLFRGNHLLAVTVGIGITPTTFACCSWNLPGQSLTNPSRCGARMPRIRPARDCSESGSSGIRNHRQLLRRAGFRRCFGWWSWRHTIRTGPCWWMARWSTPQLLTGNRSILKMQRLPMTPANVYHVKSSLHDTGC